MVDTDARIRETIIGMLSRNSHGAAFRSQVDLDQAVSIVTQRYDQLVSMCERLSPSGEVTGESVDNVKDWVNETKPILQPERVFPQNNIPLIGFVPPTCSNGICALPHRVDCLSGSSMSFPDHHLEGDLLMAQADIETLSLAPSTSKHDPSDLVFVKRMKVKHS